jgi:hypothetical protein
VSFTGASSAYDPVRDVFWVLPAFGQAFAKYDPNANGGNGSWTQYSGETINIDALSAIDPTRDLFVTLDSRSDSADAHRVVVHDLKNPAQRLVKVTTVGDRAMEFAKAPGFEWDPIVRKFVGWAGGTEVYTLTPPSGDWRTGTWLWSKVPAAPTNVVSPTAPNGNGTYSRWRYVPSVNAYIVANRVDEPVYLYKLSSAAPLAMPSAPGNLAAQ